MKKYTSVLLLLALSLSCIWGCIPNQPRVADYEKNFEALWRIINERYCFLDEKEVDWDQVHTEYSKRIKSEKLDDLTFFNTMAEMLEKLKDGHVNLITPFNTSRYSPWEKQDPTEGLNIYARRKTLGTKLFISGGMAYHIFQSKSEQLKFGYIMYGSFTSSLGNMPLILSLFKNNSVDGIILDLRANGGGSLQNTTKLLSYFFGEKTLVGYTSHKVGPGRNQFSELRALYVEPDKTITWVDKPVIILQDKGCYSATNDFLYKIACAPNVTRVGIRSGGGAGLPATQELPNGWRIRYSAVKNYDRDRKYVEAGVEPDVHVQNQGYSIDPGASDLILQKGIKVLKERVKEQNKTTNNSNGK